MASHVLDAFLDVESTPSSLLPPQKAQVRDAPPAARTPDAIEVAAIHNEPSSSGRAEVSKTLSMNIETSQPPNSPVNINNGTGIVQSFSSPSMNKWRMLAICSMTFANGLNDSAPGALLPSVEKHYGIGYAVVSLIFVTVALGFITSVFVNHLLTDYLGRSKTFMIAQALMAMGYLPIVCTPPFPIVVAAFFCVGLGIAVNLALGNVFTANLRNSTLLLGFMHGSYGMGGTIAPLIATAMIATGHLIWTRFYIIALSLAVINLAFAGWAFESYEAETGHVLRDRRKQSGGGPNQLHQMLSAAKTKNVLLGALFIFAYQGAEVSISGWVISFLITSRGGNPSSVGFVTSGFWGGITLGRFLLSQPAHMIGEKVFVFAAIVGAAVFQLLVWLVPNVVGDAVAVAIVGLLLGPVYPCAMVILSRSIPLADQVNGLSFISAMGSSGGAVAPFITGILAQVVGTFVLHPIAIGLFGVMLVCWSCLPKIEKRSSE